jgi:autotransporter translocation and assembly factor TamB
MRVVRRFVKWVAVTVAVVCVIVLALLGLSQTAWGRERARRVIESRASAALNGEVKLGSFRWSPEGNIEISNLVITQGGQPFLSSAAVQVSYHNWQVLRGGLNIDEVKLERPSIQLIERADGWNVLKLLRERTQKDPKGTTVRIGRVLIHDGSLSVTPLDAPAREFAALNIDTDVKYVNRQLRANVASGSARDARTGLPISRIRLTATMGDGETAFQDIDLVGGTSHVTGKVRWASSAEQAKVDVALSAQPLSFAEAGAYIPRLRDIPLSPSLQLRASGTMQKMAVDLSMTSEAGDLASRMTGGFQNGVATFKGDADVKALDLEPWLTRRDLRSRITGHTKFDLTLPDAGFDAATVTFATRLSEIAIAGYAASGVQARGTYRPGQLDVDGSGRAYGVAFTTAARWERASGELAARGRFSELDLRKLPQRFSIPPMESVLAGTYDTVVGPRASRVHAVLEPSVVLGARIAAGATGHVDTAVPGIEYSFHGAVSDVDPDRFKPFIPIWSDVLDRLHGRLNAAIDLDARGTSLDELSLKLQTTLTDSIVCVTAAGCGGAEPSAAATRVDRLEAAVALEAGRLVADVKGDLRSLSAASLGVERPVDAGGDGHIDAHVVIADVRAPLSVDAVEGSVRAAFANASLLGVKIDEATVDAVVGGGLARVNALDVRGSSANLTAQGTVVLTGKGQSDLTYVVDASDIEIFQPLTPHPLDGSAHLEGRVTGPAGALQTKGALAAGMLRFGPLKAMALKSTFDLAIPENNLKLTTGQAAVNGAYLEVSGTRIDEVIGTVHYDGTRFDADVTAAERARTLRFKGSVVPHPEHHEIHMANMSLLAADIEWRMPPGQEAVAQYSADRLVVRGFELVRGDARIRIDGTASASAGTESPLVVTVERMRLEDVNRVLPGAPPVSGLVEGTARISGAIADPRIDADVAVRAGTVEGVAFDYLGGQLAFAGQQLRLDLRLEAGASGRVTAAGIVPIRRASAAGEPPPFDLRIQSPAVSLALLQPLTTHLDTMAGMGQLDVQVTGAASAPRIEGLVGVRNGSFRVAPTGVVYSGVEAAMAIDGDRLTVQQVRMLDAHGHAASVTGSLKVSALSQPSEFNLAIQARDFHVLDNRFGEVSLSPELRVMGNLQAPLVTGTIRVDRGRLEVSDILDRFGASGYRSSGTDATPSRRVEEAVQTAAPTPGASYSVTVEFPDNVLLRGRDLRGTRGSIGMGDINVTLGGALTVAKDTGGPTTLQGRLVVIRGQYSFQGRPFTILRDSELRFDGEEVLNPALDVKAERQISGVVAEVHVTGTLREPEIALSSDPPLDEGDILSLIAFNQTMNQLQTSQRVSLAARAGVLAARAFATPISDSVARALDFDLFEVQPADDTGTGATVTIGRQVSDRLFVGFRHEFGSEDVTQVSFEYRLSEYLRVVTSFAEGADLSQQTPRVDRAGLDFIFVIRR